MQVEIEQKHRQKMEEIVKMHEEELRRQKTGRRKSSNIPLHEFVRDLAYEQA